MVPPNISPPGAFNWKIILKYKVKQAKTVNLLPTIRLAQSMMRRKFPSVDKPPTKINPWKRAFEKYKSLGLFSEFYGIWRGAAIH